MTESVKEFILNDFYANDREWREAWSRREDISKYVERMYSIDNFLEKLGYMRENAGTDENGYDVFRIVPLFHFA